MTTKEHLFKTFFLFSLILTVACSDTSSTSPSQEDVPTPQEDAPAPQPSWWETINQSKNIFKNSSLISFTKDKDSGLKLFFLSTYNWYGDTYNILDTTITLNDFRYILLDYTISDASSCSVSNMKLYMDGESVPFNLNSTPESPQKHFSGTFDFPDFANDHVFKIHFDSDECHNIQMTFNVTMSKEPGVTWMASDIMSDPDDQSSFPMGDLILGLQPVLWNSFGELVIPDTTYSHCILVKAGMPPDTLRLPLQFMEPSGHKIPVAYLSYYKSEELINFLGTDSIAQLSCALFYKKWVSAFAPKDTNHYSFSRTLHFTPRKTILPKREIIKLDSINFLIISSKDYGFDYFIAKYKLKGDSTLYYQKVRSNNKSEDQDTQTISISPNDSITALLDTVSIFMVKESDIESYPIYKDVIYLRYNVPSPFNEVSLPIDSTGNITKAYNRLTAILNEDSTIKSYTIFNTTVESLVEETESKEASPESIEE